MLHVAIVENSYFNVKFIWTDDPCNMIQVYVCSKCNYVMLNVTCCALNNKIVYASIERRLMHVFRPSLSAVEHIRELLSGLLSLMQPGNAYGDVLRHLFWRHARGTKDAKGHQK